MHLSISHKRVSILTSLDSPSAAMPEWWQIQQTCEWEVFEGKLWRVTTYTSGWKDWMHGFNDSIKVSCCVFSV